MESLQESLELFFKEYMESLGDIKPSDMYSLAMSIIEPPLLKAVLKKTRGNQSKASLMLGINRNTLRKKLKQYEMI